MVRRIIPRRARLLIISVFIILIGTIVSAQAAVNGDAKLPPGGKSVTGSTVNSVTPSIVPPGTTTDICFSVTHVDNDYEYLDRFDVDLPDGWTVNSVANTPDNNGCGDGTTQGVTSGNVVYWQTVGTLPTGCGSWDDVTVSFCVNVTIPDCTGAPWTIPWNIVGDGYGGPPHTLAGSISLACGVPTGTPVLVISPDNDISSLWAALSAYPDYYPVRWNNASGNPTAADMAPYCAVVIGNDLLWTSPGLDKVAIGNALADFIDAGGHVIESEYIQSYDSWGFGGRYMTGGYSPFTISTLDNWDPDTMTITAPAHPVMAGVSSIGDNFGQQNPGLASGATLLATWTATSYNAVAVKPNVVALNMLLCQSADWTGDVPLLLHNALEWLCPTSAGPILNYNSRTFTDSCSIGGLGDLNGTAEPGEDIGFSVTIRNSGGGSATGVSVTITSATPGVTITDGTAAYGDLASGASGTNLDPLTISVGEGVACLSQINVDVTMTSNEGSWSGSFTLDVGQAGSAVTDFAENFDSTPTPGLPAGWLTQVISGNAWANSNYNSCSSPNSLRYPYNSSQAADSWAYTPGINLQSGTTYTLDFNYRTQSSGTFPESLEVWIGTGQANSSMTNMIWSRLSFVSSTCSSAAPTFTAPATGTYYIGFHCVSAADMYYLYVDDINLTHLSTGICNICVCATITLSPATLPDGILATAYNQSVTASGGTAPYAYAVTTGALPDGLTLDPATGVISGTPTTLETATFSITATDDNGCTGTADYSITVACPVITLAPATLPAPVIGIPYNQTLTASGGTAPYSYVVTMGALPTGFLLDSATGVISGTPTASGAFTFTITATDANMCTGLATYTMSLNYGWNMSVVDDAGRSSACLNTDTGYFAWTVLTGFGAGTYVGHSNVTFAYNTYYFQSSMPSGMNMKINMNTNKASGTYMSPPLRERSICIDNDITDNPACP